MLGRSICTNESRTVIISSSIALQIKDVVYHLQERLQSSVASLSIIDVDTDGYAQCPIARDMVGN